MIDDARRRSLGRGLSALLGEEDAAPEAAPRTMRIDLLRPGRYQRPETHPDMRCQPRGSPQNASLTAL